MKSFLKGKKTYLVGIGLFVNELLHKAGKVDDGLYEFIRNLLGAGGVMTIAAKMNRVEAKLLILLPLLLLMNPTSVSAQIPTAVYEYDAQPSVVATYTQVIKVDSTTIATPPVCTAIPSNKTSCSVPLGTLAPGSHVISIAATKAGMTSELRVTGVDPNNAPKSPTNLQINITINITVP